MEVLARVPPFQVTETACARPAQRPRLRPGGRRGSTHRGNAIYLHILRWPSDTITSPAIARKIVRHRVLTGGSATLKQSESGIEVGVAAPQRHAIDTIVRLELDGPAAGIAAMRPA